jgi:hypothetical protein
MTTAAREWTVSASEKVGSRQQTVNSTKETNTLPQRSKLRVKRSNLDVSEKIATHPSGARNNRKNVHEKSRSLG